MHTFKGHVSAILLSHCVSGGNKKGEGVYLGQGGNKRGSTFFVVDESVVNLERDTKKGVFFPT